MPHYANEWFLFEIDTYIAALNELRRQIVNACTAISISLARLFLMLLKRTICIVKNWLKTVLHGMYLTLFEDLYVFLYVLHFFRAFLTLVDFFTDQDNKNLVEVYKFLYALFKVLISILMLTFMLVLMAHGLAPLATRSYQTIKILFYTYTYSKFAISFFTFFFSRYQLKTCNKDPDHEWLKANYRANLKKHFEILAVAIPITVLLTLISWSIVTGPWIWVVLGLASLFLVVDMAKAIYYHRNNGKIPEPEVGKLTQQNPFLDVSMKNYYYRKCRSGRLEIDNIEKNRIYLLKEIVVKIMQLQAKLANTSVSRFGFFSEKKKIQQKISGLIQLGNSLIKEKGWSYEETKSFFDKVILSLQENYLEAKTSYNKLFDLNDDDFTEFSLKNNAIINNILWEIFLIEPSEISQSQSQSLKQSLLKKNGDCCDLLYAKVIFNELEQKSNELKTNQTSLVTESIEGDVRYEWRTCVNMVKF